MSSFTKTTILHICFDYPDTNKRPKTKAIKNLIDTAQNFSHIVISLNRRDNPFKTSMEIHGNVFVFNIFYLKYGIFLNFFLKQAARKIYKHIKHLDFDLIHSHKLTFEGVIGDYLAEKTHKKHIVTIRGNTDFKVLNIKRFSTKKYLNILKDSANIISVSPWVETKLQSHFGQKFRIEILPNISFIERFQNRKKTLPHSTVFISTFIFERNNHIIKNLSRLLQAFSLLLKTHPHLKMKIIGDGSQRNMVYKYISKHRLENHVILPGYQNPEELRKSMHDCIGFLMPSYPETFGLVYLEALSAGLPILYSRNAGVDGYFSSNIAIGVNHRSVSDISNKMNVLYIKQASYKNAVEEFIANGGLKQFETNEIIARYSEIVIKTKNT